MPHLDANALESDPEGMAFVQEVIGTHSAVPDVRSPVAWLIAYH